MLAQAFRYNRWANARLLADLSARGLRLGVKVSARAPRELVARGLDLAAIMRDASKRFGGEGGGHHGAAGQRFLGARRWSSRRPWTHS